MKRILCIAGIAILITALGLPSIAGARPPHAAPNPETVVSLDPAQLEMPESLEVDRDGNLYLSLSFSGEIRKIAPNGNQSTVAVLPIGPPLSFCGVFLNAIGPITLDRDGTLYASVLACDPANRGVWKISPDGDMERLATLPLTGLPNGIARFRDHLFVADTILGLIWRVPVAGGTAEVWLDDPLVAPAGPGAGAANGMKLFRNELLVSNTGKGTIVAIPLRADGSHGTPRVYATLPAGFGCDDFDVDVLGRVYCATAPGNTVVRLDRDGTSEAVLTQADGLDIPTAARFGKQGTDRFDLYVTSGSYSVLGIPTSNNPNVLRLRVPIPGALTW